MQILECWRINKSSVGNTMLCLDEAFRISFGGLVCRTFNNAELCFPCAPSWQTSSGESLFRPCVIFMFCCVGELCENNRAVKHTRPHTHTHVGSTRPQRDESRGRPRPSDPSWRDDILRVETFCYLHFPARCCMFSCVSFQPAALVRYLVSDSLPRRLCIGWQCFRASRCFFLFVGISPRIQIGHACPSSLPPPPCQKLSKVEFCKVRLAHSHHQHDCVCSRRLYTYLEEEEDSGGFGLFTPTETFFVFKLWGRRLPELTLQFQFHPETALPVSQWVRGGIRPAACQATASNYLSFTHPTFLSWSFVLPARSLKHISATPNLSVKGF